MHRLLAAVITTALLGGVVATATSGTAGAAPVFTRIDGDPTDGRFLQDASDDGRYVLTESDRSFNSSPRVIDTTTGLAVSLPIDAARSGYLSGDGQRIVFATTEALVAADTDTMLDVFSMSLTDNQDVRWLSPGWDTYDIWPIATDGPGATVVVRASSRAMFDGRILVGGATGLRDMARPSNNFKVLDVSADGSVVLFAEDQACAADPTCSFLPLRRLEVATGSITTVTSDSGEQVEVMAAAITSDGSCLVYLDATELWRQCLGTPRRLVTDMPVAGTSGFRCTFVDMSPDGDTVVWLSERDTTIPGGMVGPHRQAFARTGDGPVSTLSGDGTTWDSAIDCLRWTSRGVLLNSTFDSFTPGGNAGIRRVHLRSETPTAPSTSTTTAVPPIGPPATSAPSVGSAGPVPGASVFSARTPLRIVDTRDGTGTAAGMPTAGTRITVPLRGRFGVPANATAVAVQLTATEGTAAGFVSLVPDAGALGRTSNLNIDEAGETIANSAVVPIGSDGSIVLYTMSPTHLILDLAGWWTPATGATSAGRFEAVGPTRFLDTRPDSLVGHVGGKPAAGSVTTIQITGRHGVPATGVSAVVLNVTIDAPASLGFVQVGPAASLVPGSSSTLNVGAVGRVMAASTIVPVDPQGRIAVYVQPSTHLVVDVAGWFTGDGAPAALDGMFVALASIDRALDTRGFDGRGPRIPAGGRRQVFANGGAVVGNLAVTRTAGPGYVQLGPNDTMVDGATSNINPTRTEETVANAFIVPAGANAVGVHTSVDTHVIIDVSGYMTG